MSWSSAWIYSCGFTIGFFVAGGELANAALIGCLIFIGIGCVSSAMRELFGAASSHDG